MSFSAPNNDQIKLSTEKAVSKTMTKMSKTMIESSLPFTYHPSPIPKELFQQALDIASSLNKLVHAASCSHSFLNDIFSMLGDADPFTAKLFSIYNETRNSGSKYKAGIHRQDYMYESSSKGNKMVQIEINTISAAFASHSTSINAIHAETFPELADSIPQSKSATEVPDFLSTCHKNYNNTEASVLFVVQPGEANVFDQTLIADKLKAKGIPVTRASLKEVLHYGELSDSGALQISLPNQEKQEIGVVYFRAGYSPDDYVDATEPNGLWASRTLLEKSNAIKCPDVSYQLVGTKKVGGLFGMLCEMQQVFAQEGVIEKFLPQVEAESVRKVFGTLLSLDERENGDAHAQLAIENCEDFVLKPQREGGGQCFFGEDIVTQLKEMDKETRRSFILMSRVHPVKVRNHLIRDLKATEHVCVSELGIFAGYLGNSDSEVYNKHLGHLVRTKPEDKDDGGVASGVAVLDSPLLV